MIEYKTSYLLKTHEREVKNIEKIMKYKPQKSKQPTKTAHPSEWY